MAVGVLEGSDLVFALQGDGDGIETFEQGLAPRRDDLEGMDCSVRTRHLLGFGSDCQVAPGCARRVGQVEEFFLTAANGYGSRYGT